MARIMLIGDSIRNSYEPLVAEILGAEGHEVWGAPGNSQFTLFTLASLGSWLTAFPEPDAVHWNNDLTTSVHPDRPFRDDQWSWRNEEIDAYNDAARLVMTELEIPINELHTLVASDVGRLLSSDQLHLSDAGKQTCAEAVCAAIRTHLPT